MSFINLLANDIWTDADITRRTESMVHSEFPLEEENILHRKVTGSMGGMYQLTEDEQRSLQRYTQLCEYAKQEGIAARNDMALLLRVFELENANLRLHQPIVEPILDESGNVINQEEIDNDTKERYDAQEIMNNASPEEMDVFNLRNPVNETNEENLL